MLTTKKISAEIAMLKAQLQAFQTNASANAPASTVPEPLVARPFGKHGRHWNLAKILADDHGIHKAVYNRMLVSKLTFFICLFTCLLRPPLMTAAKLLGSIPMRYISAKTQFV